MTMTFAVGTLVKVSLILLIGWALTTLLRDRAASLRHLVWTLTAAAALAMAPLSLVLPPVSLGLPAMMPVPTAAPFTSEAASAATIAERPLAVPTSDTRTLNESSTAAQAPESPSSPTEIPAAALPILWLLGAVSVLGWYGLGHLGINRLVRGGEPGVAGPWPALLRDARRAGGIAGRVRLLRSAAVGSPVIWGIRRPVILLPVDADDWSEERARVVLRHELAHARRLDGAVQLLTTAACALYWFHPLMWFAARSLKNEGERACDDIVLASGEPGSTYAGHLLDVARGARLLRSSGSAVIGMARPSHLEGRLLAVLDEQRVRGSTRQGRALVGAGLAAVVFLLAAARPGQPASTPELATLPAIQAAILTPSAVSPAARDTVIDREVEARPGETLTLELESGGRVEIRGWDEDRVSVRARLGGRDWEDTELQVGRVSGGVLISAHQAHQGRSSSTSHIFEIRVPKRFDVHIESAGGGVSISDVDGTFTGHSGGGGLAILRANGRADLRTGGGEIAVTDSDLEGTVSTGGGRVVLSGVSSGLSASSGSGPVIAEVGGVSGVAGSVTGVGPAAVSGGVVSRGISGNVIAQTAGPVGRGVFVTKAGGAIRLDDIPNGGTVQTGGGDIRIAHSGGPVEAHTGGGDITLDHVAGSVVATSGAGRVTIRIDGSGGGERSVSVVTVGDVVLDLPADLMMEFDLESAYTENFERATRIESPWELRQEETDRWDTSHGTPRRYVRAAGTAGSASGGALSLIRVRTVNGDITLRRH